MTTPSPVKTTPASRHELIAAGWAELQDKLLKEGVEALSDCELLTLLMRHNVRSSRARVRASRLLLESGGLRRLSRLPASTLVERQGMSASRASALCSAFELGRRSLCAELGTERPNIASFDAVVAWARPRLAALDHEEVWILGLDCRNHLRMLKCVARGGQHGCALTARDLLRPALLGGATALVVVHNHPSGDPTPSQDDLTMTRALTAACTVVGIPLLDHVIVSRGGASSLLELGVLKS